MHDHPSAIGEAVRSYLWLIPGLPLAAAAFIGFFGKALKGRSHWPCAGSIAASFVLSLLAFLAVYADHSSSPTGIVAYYPWIQTGSMDIGMALRADALSTMMACMVTFIATFIAIYASGYMAGDPGYPRFFAGVAGFVAAMTILVLGDNLFVLYAGWEGVGLCSYLLIGFWFYKKSAADAARKAFLMTRLGDVGLFLGLLMLWFGTGHVDFVHVFDGVRRMAEEPGNGPFLFAASLLLFCGAVGKSAQFPLHVWLPDAMEGPTPVSALIHAATMVTAGVYLLARCTPLFMVAPEAQLLVATIGGMTALMAAVIALTQTDLKRVMAYSTVSQLGYMFLGLGSATMAGGPGLVSFAVAAAMFHLFTHAFFKSLLFLSSGSVMIGMGHVIDMRRFSGLRQVMPVTHGTFLIGALALAGFPLLSGFWSKDEILAATYRAGEAGGYGANSYLMLLGIGLFTAFLTAFYTFRAYFLTFWGPLRVPAEADGHHGDHGHDDHGHDSHGHDGHGHGKKHHAPVEADSKHPRASYESPASMTVPLVVLAVFAAGVGALLASPLTPEWLSFAHYIEKTPGVPHAAGGHSPNVPMMLASSIIALAGIALAYFLYVVQPALPGQIRKASGALYRWSKGKLYIDELYMALIVRPAEALGALLAGFDKNGVDATADALGRTPRLVGNAFRPMQNGLVQFYALAMVLGLTVFLLALVRSL